MLRTVYKCLAPLTFSPISVLTKEQVLLLFRIQNRSASQQCNNHLLQVIFFFLPFLLFLVFSACFTPLLLLMLCTSIFLFVDQEYSPQVLQVHFCQEPLAQLSKNLTTCHIIFVFFPWTNWERTTVNVYSYKCCLKFMLLYSKLLITGQVIQLSTTSKNPRNVSSLPLSRTELSS